MSDEITLILSRYEVEALMSWHAEQQYECSRKEEYTDAEWHKQRRADLVARVPIMRPLGAQP